LLTAIILISIIVVLFSLWKYPSIALSALLCMFSIKQWAQSINTFFVVHNTLINWSIACILVFAVTIKIVKGNAVFSNYPKAGWLVIVLFIYSFMSILWTPITEDKFYSIWSGESPYLVLTILLCPLLISSTEDLSDAFKGLIILGTVVSLLLLFTTKWTGRGVQIISISGRKDEGNPLAVAQMAGYLLSAAMLINYKGLWRPMQILRWGIAAICIAVATKSGSRGQFLSMIVVAVMFIPVSRKISNIFNFVMLFVSVTILGYFGDWALNSFTSQASDARWQTGRMGLDVSGRFNSAFKLLDHWWHDSAVTILLGLGNSASFDRSIIGFYSHVVPLEILGEEGLIGAALFLCALFFTLKSFFRMYKTVRPDPMKRGILATLSALFCLELFLCFKQGSMLGSAFLFGIIILLGKYELIVMDESKKELTKDLNNRIIVL
jgi:hypothetical protein